MTRRLTWLVLIVLGSGAISCAGKASGPSSGTGSGGGDGGSSIIPVRPCSNDGQCSAGSACVANQCLVERTNVDDLAIEINPPSSSASQITEVLPSGGTITPVLEADGAFALPVVFTIKSGSNSQNTTLPASAAVILTVPSRIAGRPDLSFQANLAGQAATLSVPQALRGAQATVTLIPTAQAEQMSPPYRIATVIPALEDALTLELPANRLLLSGHVRDAFGEPKTTYTARAFQQGLLVSSNGSTSANATSPGAFSVALPGSTISNVALELVPDSSNDPWVTFNDPLSPTQPNTDLGVINLPGYLAVNLFRVPVYGGTAAARTPVVDARVRAYTKFDGADGDPRISTKYLRDGTTDVTGGANLQLIPGDSSVARPYTISVVPTAGSQWASRCITDVPVAWTGQSQNASQLTEVLLLPRSVISGVVWSATGAPVENLLVRATLIQSAIAPPCLPSPTTTSVTTVADGSYRLPVDPGLYQLDYIPMPGSSIPRFTVEEERVAADVTRDVIMPAPALVEGDLVDAVNAKLPNATIRFFQTRCQSGGGCKSPLLRAEVQSDAEGHFRAVVAAPPGAY